MDMTNTKLSRTTFSAQFAPIFWEPYLGSGERVVALIAVAPSLDSSHAIQAQCYSVLPEKRLSAMLGKSKGASARAILAQSAEYLTERLKAGLALPDAIPPFSGFSVGAVRRSSGRNIRQLLDAATRSVSAFGSVEEIFPEDVELARHATTTREFLSRVRKSEFGIRAKDRFNKRLKVSSSDENSPEVTIDYCHVNLIVQATSLPSNTNQLLDLRQEAESKFFEIHNLRKLTDNNSWIAKLFLNIEALEVAASDEARVIASKARSDIEYFAKHEDVDLICVESADAAITKLETLE